ncbi:DUF551 domain-containing protein [Enterocloster aldenensis]|uniref:DUF551 domain-containing protein n=1 Tax=Enterocloster aldenensis TaxID=358742 RepID=UPI001D064E6E|nr:DUF551 domain-containing protein [Enterocloster aldenensis]
MRLIDADKLMDNLRGNVLVDVTPELEDAVAEQPTAQRWIPVSEQLPGTERILVTNGEVVKEGYRRPDGVWKYGREEDELFSRLSSKPVIAWMSLPKPFNPQN